MSERFEEYCECTVEYTEDRPRGESTKLDYLGNGLWKCPKCQTVIDHSKDVFQVRVRIEKKREDGSEWVETTITEPFNQKLLEKEAGNWGTWKEILQEEITEGERFEGHPEGTFDMEILCYDYRCSYEYEEYETVFQVITEKRLERGSG